MISPSAVFSRNRGMSRAGLKLTEMGDSGIVIKDIPTLLHNRMSQVLEYLHKLNAYLGHTHGSKRSIPGQIALSLAPCADDGAQVEWRGGGLRLKHQCRAASAPGRYIEGWVMGRFWMACTIQHCVHHCCFGDMTRFKASARPLSPPKPTSNVKKPTGLASTSRLWKP